MNKVRRFKHNSYKALIEEFFSTFPEFADQVHDYDKHVWTKTRRGIKVHLKNGLMVLFEVMDFHEYYDEEPWTSFRAILVPSFSQVVEDTEEK